LEVKHSEPHGPLRGKEYPSVEDQLDMLWQAMDKGQFPRAEPFYSTLKKVKDKYPKPPARGSDKTPSPT
jgi:hypothetical protein